MHFFIVDSCQTFLIFAISQGPDSVKLLRKLCSADIDKPAGTTVYTGMQNEKGGYVVDCTISKTDANSYVNFQNDFCAWFAIHFKLPDTSSWVQQSSN
jgi:glycine cleavage system aminomethyltransferase T